MAMAFNKDKIKQKNSQPSPWYSQALVLILKHMVLKSIGTMLFISQPCLPNNRYADHLYGSSHTFSTSNVASLHIIVALCFASTRIVSH
jgi:hypothetical protein